MKKEIIFFSLMILLIPNLVYAVELGIENTIPFPSTMIGGNTYTSQFKITNNYYKAVPVLFRFYINKTTSIDPSEYNLLAYFSDLNLDCSQLYPGYWECLNGTNYYRFPPFTQKNLNLNLSLHIAIVPAPFNYTLEVVGPYLDDVFPIITLVAPSNGSSMLMGTLINLTVEDNLNVSTVWYTRSIFYESFSASGGTASDNPWTFSDATWIAENGKLNQTGSITQTYALAGDTSWTDYILESKLRTVSSNPETYVGVSFRVQNDGRQYWTGIYNDNSIEVWRLDIYPGSWTQLSDWSGYTFDSSWHKIKVRAIGSNFYIYWDDVYVGSFFDNTYTSGKIGLHTAYNNFVNAQFDDVKVSTLETTLFSGSVNHTEVIIDTTSWPGGLTVLDAYANDTPANNVNHTLYLFTIDVSGPNITFVDPTPSDGARGKDNWIFVNTTADDISNVDTCIIEWNGTNETMNKIGGSAICFINKTTYDGAYYTYKVYARDYLGNEASSNLRAFRENTRPTLDNISSNITCAKQGYPVNITTVNAHDADSDVLTLFINSSVLCNVTGQPELSCVFFTPWNDTTSHIIYGSVNDSWEISEMKTLTIYSDNLGPNPPTLLMPANNSVTNSNPNFTWSVPIDIGCNGTVNRYRISIYSNPGCTLQNITAQPTSNSYKFPDPFSNGTYYWRVRARDGFNNWGNWSECMKLVVDAIPPRVENPYINDTVELGDNVFARVDAWDENGVDKVILERYSDLYKFDFGNNTSPVENGYTRLTRFMLKNSTNDFGWAVSPTGDRDRLVGTNLTRDLIFDSVDRTLLVNVSNGKYLVTVIIGDMNFSHDRMNVYAENQLKINNINTSTGQIKWLNFTVNVNDGQLNITFHDNGGSDLNWVCNGLLIKYFAASYNMNYFANNTYTVTILGPPLGNHTVLYFANDTLGNVNDTVLGYFNVITPSPAKVISVLITPNTTYNNLTYVGIGKIWFNITFDKKMNTSVPLNVTYGNVTPYNNFTVIGNWISSKTWGGYSNVNSTTPNGNYTLNISGKDLVGNLMNDISTSFIIDTDLPRILSLVLSPSVIVDNHTYIVKGGNITFTITFNLDMNQTINPRVKFGRSPPYSTYVVNGSWINDTIWRGSFNITSAIPNQWYTISVSGAEDNLIGRMMVEDTSYRFLVDTKPPKIWDIQTSNITIEENETISVKVKDEKTIGQESSGIDNVLIELNGTVNYTMNFAYKITYIGGVDYVYYIIINNTQFGNGTQNLTFYVSDIAGNVNSNATASFFVNGTIPTVGGKIAFLCRNNPVNGTSINGTCNDDIEPQLISWLRSKGWNVTVNIYYKWNNTGLLGYDLMVCSDERYACDYATKSTTDVYYMHKNKKMPFVEISDDSQLRASYNFNYVSFNGGSSKSNVNSLYVTTGHPITSGYFGSTQIFSINNTMSLTSDIMLKNVKDIADIQTQNGKSTLFSKDQLISSGRFVYVGWFYRNFFNLNSIGNKTLARAISWAQCGNAKGCL